MSQITQLKQAKNQIKAALSQESSLAELKKAIPRWMGMPPERFVRMIITACDRTPQLLLCERDSFFTAVMTAAQSGIPIDGVHGALIPRNIKGAMRAQFMPMYRGLLSAARASGDVKNIEARLVYEEDEFDVDYGSRSQVTHKPMVFGERGEILGAYAIAHMANGSEVFEIMSKDEIEDVRRRAKAKSGPWQTDWGEMARKTVLRRLCKILPTGGEVMRLAARDEAAEVTPGETTDGETWVPEGVTIDVDPQTGEVPGDPLDELADEIAEPAQRRSVSQPKKAQPKVRVFEEALDQDHQHDRLPDDEPAPGELYSEAETLPEDPGGPAPHELEEPPDDVWDAPPEGPSTGNGWNGRVVNGWPEVGFDTAGVPPFEQWASQGWRRGPNQMTWQALLEELPEQHMDSLKRTVRAGNREFSEYGELKTAQLTVKRAGIFCNMMREDLVDDPLE